MKLKSISPLVPVMDLDKSSSFFQTALGFEVKAMSPGYVYLQRDSASIRLVSAGDGVDTHDPKRQLACYIDVEGIDELYAQLKPQLDLLPDGRVRAPFDQVYGQREFHVIDEDSLLLFFGEAIKK